MAMRRPRIKATALLTTKRKSRDVKSENTGKSINDESRVINDQESAKALVQGGKEAEKEAIIANNAICETVEASIGAVGATKLSPRHVNTQSAIDTIAVEKSTNAHKKFEGVSYHTPETNVSNTDYEELPETEMNDKSTNGMKNKASEPSNTASDTSFKCPTRIEYMRSNSHATLNAVADDGFYTDIEDNILQSDLQKTTNGYPMSPSKQQSRQRIRPVPVFQRRNSFVGATSIAQTSLEDVTTHSAESSVQSTTPISQVAMLTTTSVQKLAPLSHRRERHYSASMAQSPLTPTSVATHHYTSHKFTPAMGLGRIRTESNCSAFSDSYVVSSKIRKNDEHSNRPSWRRDLNSRIVNGNLDKSTLKMFDLIYYNPVTNAMEKRTTMSTIKKESATEETDIKNSEAGTNSQSTDEANNAMPVPQLKLNANGDLILDEKTLEIETTAEQEARKVLANSSLIFLDENTGMNGFYKRQKRTKEWPSEETIKFYRCLQTVGTDFSLMCQLFPKRTRRDLKLKFKKEERHNLTLINKALLYPKLFNIDELKDQLEMEEREREEALQRWKEIREKEAKSIKKVKVNSSTAARILKHGDDVYENENIIKRKLGKRAATSEKKKTNDNKRTKTALPQSLPIQSLLPNDSSTSAPTIAESIVLEVETTIATESSKERKAAPLKVDVTHTNKSCIVKTELSEWYGNSASGKVRSCNGVNNLEIKKTSDILQHGNEEDNVNFSATSTSDATEYGGNVLPNQEKNVTPIGTENIESKSFADLDNGTINIYEGDVIDALMDATPATPSQRELDECDIEHILTDLADGSLVLVSTLDPDNVDQVINEIYMMDKSTGELCDKPLDIPESIVQCILSVMS